MNAFGRTWTLAIAALSLASIAPAATWHRTDEKDAVATELAALVSDWSAKDSPGGVLGVLRDGEPWIVHAFGAADLAAHEPCTPNTPFYIASTAKQFTAACVAHAAHAGRLSLDDAITKHVPSLPSSYRPVTLRHLMHHRSGVKDVYELVIAFDLGRDAIASNAAAVALLAKLPELDFAPGERCMYSNSNYVLLAQALHAATGSTLPEYARKHVFGPLKMESARYIGEPATDGRPRAKSYRRTDAGWQPLEIATGLVGPGGLWASFSDLAGWESAWLHDAFGDAKLRDTLLAPPKLAAGQLPHPVFGDYAGGLLIGDYRGARSVRHAGGAFGFSAELLRFPDAKVSIVVLSNASDLDARGLAERAADVVLRDSLAAPVTPLADAALTAEELAALGRMWIDERSGIVWILTLRPDRMVVASLGDVKFSVVADGPRALRSVGVPASTTLAFEPAEGAASRMIVRCGASALATCRPVAFPPVDLAAAAEYEGEYTFEAAGAKLHLKADGERLVIVQERPLLPTPPFVLPPFQGLARDLYVCDAGAQLTFTRDAQKRVTSVRLDVSRARGLVFERR